MPLSKEAIESFRVAYRKSFNEDIPFNDAAIMARELLWFIRELCAVPAKERDKNLSPSCGLDDFPKISD